MGKRKRKNKKPRKGARYAIHLQPPKDLPHEMVGRGKERMPTMAERSERERTALERLRDLNQQEW